MAVSFFSWLSLMVCGPVRLRCGIRSGFKFQLFCLVIVELCTNYLIHPESRKGKSIVAGPL